MSSYSGPVVEPIDDDLIRWASEYLVKSFGIFPDTVNNQDLPFASCGIPKDMVETFVAQAMTQKSLVAFKIVLDLDIDEPLDDEYRQSYREAVPELYPVESGHSMPVPENAYLFTIERTSIPLYHCGDMSFKTYLSAHNHLLFNPVDDEDNVYEVTGFKMADVPDGEGIPRMNYMASAYVEAANIDEAIFRAGYRVND